MASNRHTNQPTDESSPEQWAEFLTPEQRLTAIADILSTIAIRVIKKRHENTPPQSN